MRARGAKVTDIVILVVAADEGVMPQTVEALNHARAAKVPIIVAINKIDRPEANLDRVKQQLSEQGLIPEDYGGDTITVGVSARTREGLDRLLEMILLQAEILDLKANPNRLARGTVIESQLDRGRGPVATVLVQDGTLHQGDAFVAGTSYGRVRAMLNHLGQRVTEAGPATPVEIFGLSGVPDPGTMLVAVTDESKGRQVAEFRQAKEREGELQKTSRVSLEELSQRMRAGEVKELKVIVKGDVQGSVEALSAYLRRLSTAEVKVDVIHALGRRYLGDRRIAGGGLGRDHHRIQRAARTESRRVGRVRKRRYPPVHRDLRRHQRDARGDGRDAGADLSREALGRAEVRQVFNVTGGTIAGSMVQDGKLTRGARVRLVRDSRVVWEGKIGSLRRFKDDVREVLSGYECGIGLENYGDVKPGDIIEASSSKRYRASSECRRRSRCRVRWPPRSSSSPEAKLDLWPKCANALKQTLCLSPLLILGEGEGEVIRSGSRYKWGERSRPPLRVLGGRCISRNRMVVGVLRLTLFLPENHSLKGKRQVLRSIKDRVRNKFNVSIAESDASRSVAAGPAGHLPGGQRSGLRRQRLARGGEFYRIPGAGSVGRGRPGNLALLKPCVQKDLQLRGRFSPPLTRPSTSGHTK